MTTSAKKLCLLGDFSVGKTSLVRRYVHGVFTPDYHATIGVQVYRYRDDIEIEGGPVTLDQIIWDIEGSRFGQDLLTNYILGASGALVIGDLTRDDALASMASHARAFLAILPGRPVVFALNKADLVAPEQRADGGALAAEFGGLTLHTSAATGEAVPTLFRALGKRILDLGV